MCAWMLACMRGTACVRAWHCVRACVRACARACVRACVEHARVCVWSARACARACVRACVGLCLRARSCTRACACVRTCIWACVCVLCVCVCVCVRVCARALSSKSPRADSGGAVDEASKQVPPRKEPVPVPRVGQCACKSADPDINHGRNETRGAVVRLYIMHAVACWVIRLCRLFRSGRRPRISQQQSQDRQTQPVPSRQP